MSFYPGSTPFYIFYVHLLEYVINYQHNTRNGKYRICKKVRSWFNSQQWQDILLFIYASRQDLEPTFSYSLRNGVHISGNNVVEL